ncbi:MAG: hypothetical protein JWQ88_3053, partial [Rhodoferax sp.]|nr:hypothetical protein [Rhodoferax sp.]
GQRAFKERAPALSTRLRAAFILIDGKRTVQDVLRATAGLGISEPDILQLLSLQFIAEVAEPAGPESAVAAAHAHMAPHRESIQKAAGLVEVQSTTGNDAIPAPAASSTLPQELYIRAYPIATRLTADLGLRGFRLNLAVEQASGYQQLVELLPKIRAAVGAIKSQPLEEALGL